MKRSLLFFSFVAVSVLIESCTSGKGALKQGNYYEAVLESVHRLRESPTNKKATAVLTQSYPLAVEYIESTIKNGISSDDPRKWRNAVGGYDRINYMNDQIKTSMGAMKIITNPQTRFKELADAKGKAAEEAYQEGVLFMMKNAREDAKQAYYNFKDANNLSPGYKESIEMMNQAEYVATLRVAYEEINNSSINYTVLAPALNNIQRQFVSFRPVTQKDTVAPHQQLRVIFNGYQYDRPQITTSIENISKQVKVGEKKGADGKPQDVMETVTGKMTYFTKTQKGIASARVTITDVKSASLLQDQKVEGYSQWQWQWGIYLGDTRALSSNHQTLISRKETAASPDQLQNQALQNLQNNLQQDLKNFYAKY
jgi:hypothetical protein